MKKIVMGIAAVAMAASMFAADVAGKLVYNTTLYGNKEVLSAPSVAYDVNNTHYTLAANGDVAGATLNIAPAWSKGTVDYIDPKGETWNDKHENALISSYLEGSCSLWFKPVDAVKITVGGLDTGSINRGTFAWWHRTVRVGAQGFMLNTNVAGVGIEFASFGSSLLNFNNTGYGIVGNFFLNATYGLGDAGNIGFVVTKGADINAYGVGGWKQAGLAMCLSYDHMPWQTTGFYADVLVNLDLAPNTANEPLLNEIGTQIGGQYVADGLALRLTAMVAYGDTNSWSNSAENVVSYGFVAWASYNIDGWEPYVKVVANELSDNNKFSVDAGVTKGFGAAAIDARFSGSYNGSAFSWSIPCTISCGL